MSRALWNVGVWRIILKSALTYFAVEKNIKTRLSLLDNRVFLYKENRPRRRFSFLWWRWLNSEQAQFTDNQNPSIYPIFAIFWVFLRGFLYVFQLLIGANFRTHVTIILPLLPREVNRFIFAPTALQTQKPACRVALVARYDCVLLSRLRG